MKILELTMTKSTISTALAILPTLAALIAIANADTLVLTALPGSVLVASPVSATEVTTGGSGCAGANGQPLVNYQAEDGLLSLSFPTYRALTADASTLDRKGCAVAMPVHVPAGKQLVVYNPTLRGWARLEVGSSAKLNLEAFVAGSHGTPVSQTLTPQTEAIYGPFAVVQPGEVLRTSCDGQDLNLRFNTSELLTSSTPAESAIRIWSLSYQVRIEECL